MRVGPLGLQKTVWMKVPECWAKGFPEIYRRSWRTEIAEAKSVKSDWSRLREVVRHSRILDQRMYISCNAAGPRHTLLSLDCAEASVEGTQTRFCVHECRALTGMTCTRSSLVLT
jgi:hypothetical protein